ncbi:conserved protein of unknown function [Methylacidimicrobium sp. AP8]|uniref:hypothetical protein n=1 Tax=Methylacidimicrobium sp. AP8 TaxID=2730359 RepID=UPI0018C04EA5|nr:hypothetical protein [Methylacidimicrobium sp. AP8]CAB4243681.1 conserved protein of unknown function [Methylacidimicrobium sp. AP8]
MALNRKLSPILRGRPIVKYEARPGQLSITFADGSCLVVRLAGEAPPFSGTGTVEKVLEAGDRFSLVLESGSRLELTLAEPGASVSLRDGRGQVEYLG